MVFSICVARFILQATAAICCSIDNLFLPSAIVLLLFTSADGKHLLYAYQPTLSFLLIFPLCSEKIMFLLSDTEHLVIHTTLWEWERKGPNALLRELNRGVLCKR